jgi:hypothetical protein
MLAKLNKELFPNLCQADREDIAVVDNTVKSAPGFYTGPPPAAPMCSIPPSPSSNFLARRIINSADRLFFISQWISKATEDIHEWRLVRVALTATMQSYPSCLDDSQYAVNFYIAHPSDFRYNVVNQHFWLQYHSKDNLSGPYWSSYMHLICPSDTSEAYARHHKHLPFR